ncbi:MAG: hypothetical protein IT338_11685 [Thermomicrobiales bacterium]|nr:hypothetical protein [Thermomicrobiales bacterium]
MYRSDWEISMHMRHHALAIAGMRATRMSHRSRGVRLARAASRLRYRLGLGLIQAGSALAGCDARSDAPPRRPALPPATA